MIGTGLKSNTIMNPPIRSRFVRFLLALILISSGWLSACGGLNSTLPPPAQKTIQPVTPTALVPAATSPATDRESHTPQPSPSAPPSTPTPVADIAGCQKPPDDYTILTVNGVVLNRRTYAMLENAASLYGGEIDILASALTQGSYTRQVSASFGTHAGGGAVDLSVMRANTYNVLWEEIPPLLQALRIAGFAAWLRDLDELYLGSPIHIHAIAIGDRDLSPAAQAQVSGDLGYFRGYSGLPPEYGGPSPDRFGAPVLCHWMIEMGYADLRAPTPTLVDAVDCPQCK